MSGRQLDANRCDVGQVRHNSDTVKLSNAHKRTAQLNTVAHGVCRAARRANDVMKYVVAFGCLNVWWKKNGARKLENLSNSMNFSKNLIKKVRRRAGVRGKCKQTPAECGMRTKLLYCRACVASACYVPTLRLVGLSSVDKTRWLIALDMQM